jgi:integrase
VQRFRFMLDFGYATGLRTSELANATLRNVEVDAAGDHWLHVTGKGGKPARVTLTPLARAALDRYLQERGLAVSRARWNPVTPLIGSLDDGDAGIKPLRLWEVMRRFSGKRRRLMKTIIRRLPRNSVRLCRTGCGTRMPLTLSPRASNSAPSATNFVTHRSRPRRFTCMLTM